MFVCTTYLTISMILLYKMYERKNFCKDYFAFDGPIKQNKSKLFKNNFKILILLLKTFVLNCYEISYYRSIIV